jgi:hypothetical protein
MFVKHATFDLRLNIRQVNICNEQCLFKLKDINFEKWEKQIDYRNIKSSILHITYLANYLYDTMNTLT